MSYASIKISEFWKNYANSSSANVEDSIKKPQKSRNDFCLQFWPSQNKTCDLHKILETSLLTFPSIWGGVSFTYHYSTESTWALPAVVFTKDLLRTTICTSKIPLKSLRVKFRRIRGGCKKAFVTWSSYYWYENGLSRVDSFFWS